MRLLSSLNTYYRLLLLIIGTSSLFFILYLCLYFYTIRQEKAVYHAAEREYRNEINSIFELNSKTHLAAIIDVTFWDELVHYIKTKNSAWYKEYVESQFSTYEVDYLGIYDLDGKCIGKSSSKHINTIGEIPKEVLAIVYKERLKKFYQEVPEGVLEVFAATIHPSDDPNKTKTKPSGYFFMARLLKKDFITHLQKITSSTITLVPSGPLKSEGENIIAVGVDLPDIKAKPIAKLSFERPFNLNFDNTKKILGIIIIGTIFNLLVYLYYYRKWVYRPISLVTDILETKDESLMIKLRALDGEFRHIGYLFKENNDQRKQLVVAKEKAEESDRLKSAFLANLSHEIRTPMNAIMGFSDLLADPNLPTEERDHYLSIIRNSGKNLTSIIEDLVEMSKIDSKQVTPNYKGINLTQCFTDLYHSIKVTIPEGKDIAFSLETKNLDRKILTDEVKLKQIVTNLLTNAIKFTKSGKISFGYRIDEVKQQIEIYVEDTGIGISEANIKIIFDRFRRIEDDNSIAISGLGLGLSITKAYVEALGGNIEVHSQVGKGSTFTLSLPLKYDETIALIADSALTAEQINASANKTILVAEDDDINYLLMKRMLQLKNYQVIRASNGLEAVNICKDNPEISLVFMDIKMPKMNGFDAFNKIREFNSQLPIIANTAYSSPEDKIQIADLGFTGYLGKPMQQKDVFALLDEILG